MHVCMLKNSKIVRLIIIWLSEWLERSLSLVKIIENYEFEKKKSLNSIGKFEFQFKNLNSNGKI